MAAPLCVHASPGTGAEGWLHAVVFGADAAPVAGASVWVEGGASATTNEDGAVVFPLQPGRYRLRVHGAGPSSAGLSEPVPISAGETTEVLLRLDAAGRLSVSVEARAVVKSPAERHAATGPLQRVAGRVVADEDGQPVAGARIYCRGTSSEALSDRLGRFSLELPQSATELTVVHGRFAAARVALGPASERAAREGLRVRLRAAVAELEAVTVTAPRIEGGLATLLDERRQARAVSDVLGAEQIAKSGDSDAAAALQRATGVTVVGGRYVYVRGLGERYSSTLLNGSTLPSPEPERRVVPLDMFPSGMLDSLVIQKSYSPEMPGEFGGGVVQLRTRRYPAQLQARISVSGGFRSGTTLANGLAYPGGSLDFLGIDDGTRALPAPVARASRNSPLLERDQFSDRGYSAAALEAFGESMPNVWSARRSRHWPDLSLSATLGDSGRIFGRKAGYIGALSYASSWQQRRPKVRILTVGEGQRLETAHDYRFDTSESSVTLGGIVDFGVDLALGHKLRFTSLLVRTTDDETRVYEGFNRDVGTDIRVTRLRWLERMLLAQQLRGEHALLPRDRLALSWRYNLSLAARSEPDRREVRFDREPTEPAVWLLSDRPEGNQRLFSDLSDLNQDVGADLKLGFDLWGGRRAELKAGGALLFRSRDVETRRYKFLSQGPLAGDSAVISRVRPEDIFVPETIGPTGFLFTEITRQTDNYEATQRVWAAHGLLDVPLCETLQLTAGARVEGALQRVTTFELFNPDFTPVVARLDDVDVLPAALLSWRFASDMQLRLGYGRTLSRPDFRELSPATFNDVTGGRQIFGNPELDRATIDNLDLRWEWYPERGETISLALFYKRFTQPIETIVVVSAQHSITYENADGATNLGAELELRKTLGWFGEAWEDLYVAGNVTVVHSRVELPPDQGIQTSAERALQGQSPFVVNAQLGYDNAQSGSTATLLYNVFGPRISEVGALGAPDIFEEPVQQLDVVMSQRLGAGFTVSARASNLLDPEIRWTQGGQTVERWRRGRAFSLGLSAAFD